MSAEKKILSDDEIRGKILSIIYWIVIILHIAYASIHFQTKQFFQFKINIITFFIFLFLNQSPWFKKNHIIKATIFGFLSLILVGYLTATGVSQGNVVLWGLTFPAVGFLLIKGRWALYYIIFCGIIMFLLMFFPFLKTSIQYETSFIFRYITIYIVIALLTYIYDFLRSRNEHTLRTLTHELNYLATTDHLTQTLNRRQLFHIGSLELEMCFRDQHKVSIILLDIDDFKKINDTWGHPVGDEAIRIIANIINKNIRECDIVGRYGGEEFLILLPQKDVESAHLVAEQMRSDFENHKFPVSKTQTHQITASFGITGIQKINKDHNIDALFSEADKAMYLAKRSGKNKIIIFDRTQHKDENTFTS